MATIPQFLIGKHITAVVVTPQTVSGTTGALSDTTPIQTFSTVFSEISIRSENDLEDISASDQRRKNMVPTASSTRITITELLQGSRADGNPVNGGAASGYGSSDYHKFTLTRSGKTYTFYAVMASYEERTNGKGKITGELVLDMIDPGVANPAYA